MQHRWQVLLVTLALVVTACSADHPVSPSAPPGHFSASWIAGTDGACTWGGDDFQQDSEWTHSDCDITAFTGDTFHASVSDPTPSMWYDPEEYDMVGWTDMIPFKWTESPSLIGYVRFQGTQPFGILLSDYDAVAFVGMVGACPKSAWLGPEDCLAWAWANSHWHGEPVFCVANPAFTLFDVCEAIITSAPFAADPL